MRTVEIAGVTQEAAPSAYTRTAVMFHWLIAVLIACGFTIGARMVSLPFSPARVRIFAYHKWIGITVLALAAARLLWRLTHPAPPLLPMPRWQSLAAHALHGVLYALMFLVPLAGWLYSSASGYPVVYLKLWQLPDLVPKNKALADVLVQVHTTLAWTLAVVVLLHVAAAVKHHLIDRDDTLRRILAWRRP
jgi:cytochrome b561